MVDATLTFISEHRDWTFAVAFLFAFAETLLIVSAIVPSTAILFGIGALVATGSLDFLPLFAGAACGAVAGSLVSWGLGRFYGPQLLRTRFVRRRIGNTRPVRRAFARWGAPAVALGHLGGPFRAVAFTLAGLSAMSLARFLPMTILGAMAWAFVTPMAGKMGGDLLGAIF